MGDGAFEGLITIPIFGKIGVGLIKGLDKEGDL
jgi:hypothetical protein